MSDMGVTRLAGGRLELFSPRPYAQVRLFGFPYAAGRPRAFRSWPRQLPRRCELLAVCYPGRGSRLEEAPSQTVRELAVEAAAAIALHSGGVPFALFGHSMGALVAFEVARELRRAAGPQPARLFVSGQAAPQLPVAGQPTVALPDEAFTERLRAIGGTPPEVLESDQLMRLLLPAIRADFNACDTYAYEPEDPLCIPIRAFAAIDDAEVSPVEVEAWRTQTSMAFDKQVLAGGHFFVHSAEQAVLQAITAALPPSSEHPQRGLVTSSNRRGS